MHSSVKLVHSTTRGLEVCLQHTTNLGERVGGSVGDMLNPLLGQVGHLADRVHDLTSGVLQFVGGLLSGPPSGSHNPSPTDTPHQASVIPKAWTGLPQLAESTARSYSGRTSYVIVQFIYSLSSGYQEPRGNVIESAPRTVIAPVRTQISASAQAADSPQQKPVVSSQTSPSQQKLPTIPAGNIPASTSMLGGSASGSLGGGGFPVLLVAVLDAGSILPRGGASSWLSGSFSRPASVLSLAIERPG